MNRRRFIALAAGMAALTGSGTLDLFLLRPDAHALYPVVRRKTFRVVNIYPHDPTAFTQGLLFYRGHLYESTGGWGTSSVRKVELSTGRVLRQRNLPQRYFGEGLAIWDQRLIQVTWKSGTGFVYDLNTFDLLETFTYAGEGWGLTQNDRGLILSDGTDTLRYLDPITFQEQVRVAVHDQGQPVRGLNELEYIHGEVWANIFPTDEMIRIDPIDGHVLVRVDMAGILGPRQRTSEAVLNGIAHDPETDRVFVTGKLWPVLYEIELVPRSST